MKTHGKSNTKLYRVWNSMKQRCYNSNDKFYFCYGGRGIKVCDEWRKDFKSFYDWAMRNGYQENLTIDRIDVNGNYNPSNCRWVDDKTQQRNRRDRERVLFNGKDMTLVEVSEETGISLATLWERKQRGVTLDSDTNRNKFVLRSDGVIFNSIYEAAKKSNTTHSSISKVCNGIRGSAKGYSFSFLTREEAEKKLKELQNG